MLQKIKNQFKPQPITYPPWQHAFSRNAMRRAWLAVRANKGSGGADGETLGKFEGNLAQNLQRLRTRLLDGSYQPHKVTQVLVPKPGSNWRPITVWAIRDRIAQRAVYNYLEPVINPHFLACSYGFRPGLTTRDVAQAIQKSRRQGLQWVVDGDIKDCFGQMNNQILRAQLKQWQMPEPIQELIARWLGARVWNAWRGRSKAAGTSQGGVISPLLCNLYLHPFDIALRQKQLCLIRYADDFVILTHKQDRAQQAYRQAGKQLKILGLEIHPQKSHITHFDAGFQFVGWFFVRDEIYELR